MQVGRRDEDVEAAALSGPDRLAGQLDVPIVTPRQRGDDGAPHLGRDLAHAPVVALGCGRKARLDDVHAERVELAGQSKLLLGRETVAGSLLAIAQGGIEDQDFAGGHMSLSVR